MERVDDRLILSASDLIDFLECPHLTHLDLQVATGRLKLEATRTDSPDLVARKGDEHELAHLAAIKEAGLDVVTIESERYYKNQQA